MLASHMESKGQKWPNVRLGEIGDISAAFNYGISDMMMNNLWVYDFNILDEPNNHISGFPEQELSDFTVSDPGSSSKFLVDMQQNRENVDPNSMKPYPTNKNIETIESKKTQNSVKGPRSKRRRRTVFEGLLNFKDFTPIDNQGSAMTMSKRTEDNSVDEPIFKIQKGGNLESNDLNSESIDRCNGAGVNSVGRWLEDVGFGRYAGMFEMHEVDEQVLPLLTLDDLKEMGVLAVGPRRKLYAAICQLRGECDY